MSARKKPAPRAKPASPAVEERRRHARFPLDECQLTLHPDSSGGDNVAQAIVDLSEGGICVRTSRPLAEGTRVRMRLVLSKFSDQIETSGTVRWCRPEEKHHTVGIMFTDLSPTDAAKLNNMRNWFASPLFRRRTLPPQK